MENNLGRVVGSSRVSSDEETLREYSSDFSFVSAGNPSLVVKPKNRGEIKEIVKQANKTQTPIIPVSSGPPRFRGDTVPADGGIVLDLSEMNDIRMIDRLDRVAMIEPGVRFSELQEELREKGLRLPTPLCPRKTKSVVGSCLEREPHVMPKYHLDHAEPLLCNEIVFGNGELFRTGEAGGPGSIDEQWEADRHQKIRSGIQMNLTRVVQGSQGTIGVVTWSTVRCEVLPEIQKPFLASAENLEDLLEFSHRLVRRRLGDEFFIVNSQVMSSLLGDKKNKIKELRESLPPWTLFFCLAGYEYFPRERVDYQEKDVEDIAKNIGIKLTDTVSNIQADRVSEVSTHPSKTPYWKIRQKGACKDIYFISSYHDIPNLIEIMKSSASTSDYPLQDIGIYIQPVCQGHGYHVEITLPYDSEKKEGREKTKSLYLLASGNLMDDGAFFSRPYGIITDMIYERDPATMNALKKIKEIFDPNHIMNPGKLCFEV